MELLIDTETTGLTNLSFANERNYRKWPRLVQVAWGVIEKGELREVHEAIIKPSGFNIPPSAELVHGIDDSKANREGRDLGAELRLLGAQIVKAKRVIAHNIRFDLGVLQSEAIRLGDTLRSPRSVNCTCLQGQAYLKSKTGKEVPYPKLSNLYRELFDKEAGDLHNAKSDMLICWKVYVRLKELGF